MLSDRLILEKDKIHDFWENRGKEFAEPCGEMANLEPDPKLQALKSSLELDVVSSKLELNPDMKILELGAGYGQWAMRFAPFVKKVCAVDYASSMIEVGKKYAQNEGISNIDFILSSAEDFYSNEKWDLIFILGLFMYLDDYQADCVSNNIKLMLAPNGKVFLRESISILPDRHLIDNQWSEALGVYYSALYRRKSDFLSLFAPLVVESSGWFFADGSPLNKWKETRLAYFSFKY